jgi:hypothetical protein
MRAALRWAGLELPMRSPSRCIPRIECLDTANPHKMAVLKVAGLLDDDRLQYSEELEEFKIFPRACTAAQLIEEIGKLLSASEERSAHASGPFWTAEQLGQYGKWRTEGYQP